MIRPPTVAPNRLRRDVPMVRAAWLLAPFLLLAFLLAACSPADVDNAAGSAEPTAVESVRTAADGSADPTATALPAPSQPPSPADLPATEVPPPVPTPLPNPSTEPPAGPELLGRFDTDGASEVSGLAASGHDPNRLWLLDDGPGTTSVIAVDGAGQPLGRVVMEGVDGRDTEALAVAPCGPGDATPCLYVGDIGDNLADRTRILVHRFPEPVVVDGGTVPVQTASFTYPDGPVDAEGMVVGPDGLPAIFTKEEGVSRVMAATAFADGPLEPIATLQIPAPTRPLLTMFVGLRITDAGLDPTGTRLLLRTYDSVLLATPGDPSFGLDRLGDWDVVEVPSAPERQGEAITWATLPGRPNGYVTVSEEIGDLWFVPAPPR